MRRAHQGVAVVALPNSRQSGFFSNVAQANSQAVAQASAQLSSSAANARPAITRTSVRPEAASGLDGWLIDRLFGR
jgi:penicillin-binding protein 1A